MHTALPIMEKTMIVASLNYIFIDTPDIHIVARCFQILETFEYETIVLLKRHSHYNTKTIPLH